MAEQPLMFGLRSPRWVWAWPSSQAHTPRGSTAASGPRFRALRRKWGSMILPGVWIPGRNSPFGYAQTAGRKALRSPKHIDGSGSHDQGPSLQRPAPGGGLGSWGRPVDPAAAGPMSGAMQHGFPLPHFRRRAVISWLNTQPARAPANASPPSSRTTTHDSGSRRFATPSSYGSFIHCSLPVCAGTPQVPGGPLCSCPALRPRWVRCA